MLQAVSRQRYQDDREAVASHKIGTARRYGFGAATDYETALRLKWSSVFVSNDNLTYLSLPPSQLVTKSIHHWCHDAIDLRPANQIEATSMPSLLIGLEVQDHACREVKYAMRLHGRVPATPEILHAFDCEHLRCVSWVG